jgi:flagellar hook-basal body complex protein FliE
MPITNIQVAGELSNIGTIAKEKPAAPGFAEHLKEFVSDVNAEMQQSEKAAADFAAGKTNNIHETIMVAEKARIAFQLLGSIRTRMIEAYNEVMRMPI